MKPEDTLLETFKNAVDAEASRRSGVPLEGLPYVIVRAYSAGVFAGYLVQQSGDRVELKDSRYCREWHTTRNGDCNDLALDGLTEGSLSRPIPKRVIVDQFEVIWATEAAREKIETFDV